MRLVRGSMSDVGRDRAVTGALSDLASKTDEPVLRVWTPPKQIAFGRRDTARDGYNRARAIALERGYEPIERDVGGSAVAYTGSTVAFGYATPIDDGRGEIDRRYRSAVATLAGALRSTGASVSQGEPDRSFCPGEHSLSGIGKIAGIAQRIRQGSALVGGCVIVLASDAEPIAAVLDTIYTELDLPFDRDSVGSLATVGGPDDVVPVIEAIEDAFTSTHDPVVVPAAGIAEGVGP